MKASGGSTAAELRTAVAAAGGSVVHDLSIIDSVAAVVPADALASLERHEAVSGIVTDGSLEVLGDEWKADVDLGSLYSVTKSTGAHDAWSRGDSQGRKVTGRGVGVALIDSGVVPVAGLMTPGRVVYGPDFSFDSQDPALRHLDTFGHGTHLAGIIAGRDPGVKSGNENDSKHFTGFAPDATLLSVKVAAADGATDVSQVIAAIDWVVQHRADPGLNIRVINLAFGTTALQSYQVDPLAHAVEMAWRKGIVVVVAAGNEGNATSSLNNPAIDPYIIAVGASDHRGTDTRDDDVVASFSSRGSPTRAPDLLAPGRSMTSLRNPASYVDQNHPGARVVANSSNANRFFRGSGTSQASAVVAGAVAVLLQERPTLTPDQVKRLLMVTARSIPRTDRRLQGAGVIDIKAAAEATTPSTTAARQSHPISQGTGSLELARGGSHVADPTTGEELTGEQDIFGGAWDGRSWADESWAGRSWAGGTWNGRSWAGTSWSSSTWTGRSWAGVTWSGSSWTGRSWAGRSWANEAWSSNVWQNGSWSGRSWAGRSWAGRSWAGRTWATGCWDGTDTGSCRPPQVPC